MAYYIIQLLSLCFCIRHSIFLYQGVWLYIQNLYFLVKEKKGTIAHFLSSDALLFVTSFKQIISYKRKQIVNQKYILDDIFQILSEKQSIMWYKYSYFQQNRKTRIQIHLE